MSCGRISSLTSSSPFANIGPELVGLASSIADEDGQQALEDTPVDVLEDFGDTAVYEDDADLDPLSAMEKYCRSELPQQRLAYAAGIGAAVDLLAAHEVSGTIVALLRELLGDVYADVRLAALQQVLAVAGRLRSAGMLYQSDIETLWDLVQKLLLDADVENQEAASAVVAELSHIVAKGNAVAASSKLVLAVQKLQRLPSELQAEGALAALRLIAEVVAPREGSPLTFSTIEEFSVGTFKMAIAPDASPDVRQAVVLLLPRFARHMPPALRASLLPGWIKALAADTHWNVRAEVPQLLINLLTPQEPKQQQQQQPPLLAAAAGSSSDGGSSGGNCFACVSGHDVISRWGGVKAGATAAAAGSVAESWSAEDLRTMSEIIDRLCRDTSLHVKVAALASLGPLLPLLPAALVVGHRPHLLSHFAATAKPPPQIASIKVPPALCAPQLGGHIAALRHRQRQQRRQQLRDAEARNDSYQRALLELVSELDAMVETKEQEQGQEQEGATAGAAAGSGAAGQGCSTVDADASSSSSSSAEQQEESDPWLLGTAHDTPVGADDTAAGGTDAASSAAAGSSGAAAAAAAAAAAGAGQQADRSAAAAVPGTAAAELPRACAVHMGKVVLHAGPESWPHLQNAFLELSVAAINGECHVAAALLLAFPDLSAAVGHQEATHILVPVVLELLHTRLDALTPVLCVMLFHVVAALPPELRICLLQLLPNLVLQIDPELAGDWRARLAVAQQLSTVPSIVSSSQAAFCLWPLLLSLARDPVFAVRAAAAHQAGQLLMHLPDQELPPEQGDSHRAAAVVEALHSAQCEQQQEQQDPAAGDEAATPSSSTVPVSGAADADAAEHAIAAVVATKAISSSGQHEQQQQQPMAAHAGSSHRLRWVKRGLSSGLYQLQQQVDRVMESPGLQKALNGMDQQLSWLQQHPQGKVLWSLGSKLAQGVRGTAEAPGGMLAPAVTVDELRQQLTSLQVMEAAELDPCKFLATPAWHTVAGELSGLGSSGSSSDRVIFVMAAGSILSAHRQRCSSEQPQHTQQSLPPPPQQQQTQQQQQPGPEQDLQELQQQQHDGPELYLQELMGQLQRLSSDPTPGVRCAVAAVAGGLLTQGPFQQDARSESGSSSSSGTASLHGSAAGSTTASSTASPRSGSRPDATGSACSGSSPSGRSPQQHQDARSRPGCSAAGMSSTVTSCRSAAEVSTTQLAVLQDCLQRLRIDPCVSVAELAKAGSAPHTSSPAPADAGAAEAAADAADAAALASSSPLGHLAADTVGAHPKNAVRSGDESPGDESADLL